MPLRIVSNCVVVLLPALGFSACEPHSPTPDSPVAVDTLPSGTVVVSNPSTGRWDEGEAWRVEEVLRIGSLDGEGLETLGGISAVEVDDDGNIVLFDPLANELRIFSPDGLPQRSIGGAGQGPGEFQSVLGISYAPDGELWIVDGRNLRYTVLSQERELEHFPRSSRTGSRPWVGGFDQQGRFFDQLTEVVDQALADFLIHVDADGQTVERFAIPRIDIARPQVGPGMSMTLPFSPSVIRAWDPTGGVWQALSAEYRITRVLLGGDTAMVLMREFEPTPLHPSQRDSLSAAIQSLESQFGVNVDSEMRPEVSPILRWLTPDDEGRLWVCATGLDPCTELDVFDRSGYFLGRVQMPEALADVPLPLIRDGRIYAAIEGEFGEPQLWVGRIMAP